MLFNNIAGNVLAVCALLASPALGLPAPDQSENVDLAARRLDVSVRFYNTGHCGIDFAHRGEGPKRDYAVGCLALARGSHGVRMVDNRPGCYMVRYEDNDCRVGGEAIQDTGCRDVDEKYNSLLFTCD